MKVDPRFLKEEGTEVYTGNELLVKGLLETDGGTHLWTGYPGSPVAGFFDCIETIQEIPKQYGIAAMIANNEALSAAMLNGSQMSGLRGIIAMKSVGVHVASDALALGNLAGAHPEGGAVVVCGEDPWSDSTQVPADSRYLAKHMHMPVLEPSTTQELKDWIDLAFKLSRESELYIAYIVTTNQADGGGSVTVRRNHFPKVNTKDKTEIDTAKIDLEKMVLLPPRTWRREQNFPDRYKRLWESAARHRVNKTFLPPRSKGSGRYPLGFVTSAMAANYLEHALRELGLADAVPILKLGVTYPLDPTLVGEFADKVERLVVVEERRGFIEEQIAVILSQTGRGGLVQLYGKKFPDGLPGFPEARGLNPSMVIETLAPLLVKVGGLPVDEERIAAELALINLTAGYQIDLVPRTPTFCAGCPHRDSASVLMEVKKDFRDPAYMRQHHRREAVDLLFHGDTGCYTMLMFEPTKDLMHNYSGMGLGGATGMGIDPFIRNKQVVFMGDSTFFHSGQLAISNSVKNGQDITYIILDNRTTAMTGHQPTPGVEADIMGNDTFTQNIDKIVSAITDAPKVDVLRVNPAYRNQYRALLEETILKDGVKVLIADKECGITFHRRKNREERAETRKRGYVKEKTFINVSADVCESCLECTLATGCPGLSFTETDFGRKIQTDLSWCVADMACTKIHACPSFEEITIYRSQKPPSRLPNIADSELPEPAVPDFDHQWHVYLAGVGGMGIASATATLVRAAHREGYETLFCDKNGLAIRNGGVFSQVTFLRPGCNHTSAVIPYGKADLIIGIDPLEAARSLDPKGNQRIGSVAHTAAIVNTAKTPTILGLLGKEDYCVETLETSIRRHTRGDDYFSCDISDHSQRIFGTKIYANIMMLGVAFQRGLLPLSLASIEWGIRETVGAAAADNYLAFKVGRKLVIDAERSGGATVTAAALTPEQTVEAKAGMLLRSEGQPAAEAYRQLVRRGFDAIELDAKNRTRLATRLADLILFEDAAFASDYLDRLLALHKRDKASYGFAATHAALWNLHRAMVIKDEVFVAALLSGEEKKQRDLERYNVHPELGDRVVYGHLNRPEFILFGKKIRFHLKSRQWMLRLMRKGKFLRRLLPAWHSEEKAFRAWFLDLVGKFDASDDLSYRRWLAVLRLPEQATGYREVRYPKLREARRRAEAILAGREDAALSGAKPAAASPGSSTPSAKKN